MSQVIACPNCDKKLAVRDELKGRALICPQCKSRFTAPADEPFDSISAGLPSQGGLDGGGSGMDFLDHLAPAPGPVAAKTTARKPSAAMPAATRPAAAKAAVSGAARGVAGRGTKKNDQTMMIYIGGGIAAAVLLIIIVAVAMSSGGGSGKKKDENPRFGLTESQRKRLFKDMFHAVDEIGSKQQYKACREEWRRLGGERQLNDQQLSEVLAEGLKQGWEQPAMEATMDQTQKTNRLEWIRTMNVSKHDPVLGK